MSQPEQPIQYRPGLKKSLKRGFQDAYDRLGGVLGVSLLCFVAFFLPFSLGYQATGVWKGTAGAVSLGLLVGLLIAAPTIAGTYVWARNVASYNDPSLMDLAEGFRKWLLKSWKLAFADLLITLIVLVNLVFYLRFPALPVKVVGIIWGYGACFWALSLIYHFPIMVEQDAGILKVWKRSALLTLDNLPFTMVIFFVIIFITTILVATVFGWVVLGMGTISLLQTHALRELFRKYGLIEPEPELPAVDNWKGFRLKD